MPLRPLSDFGLVDTVGMRLPRQLAQRWRDGCASTAALLAGSQRTAGAVLAGPQRMAGAVLERSARWAASARRCVAHHLGALGQPSCRHVKAERHGAAAAAAAAATAEASRLRSEAGAAELAMDPRSAYAAYAALLALPLPHDACAFATAAKQLSDCMYAPPHGECDQRCDHPGAGRVTRAEATDYNTRALALADAAVANDPSSAAGYIARCVCAGRLALVSDNRTKVQLAKAAAADAAEALRLAPDNDLAHHLMGRWHYEMSQIGPLQRGLIKLLFGTSLMEGRLQDGLEHFRTAALLKPARPIHHVEIGRTLMKLGDCNGAAGELSASLSMPVEDINARLQLDDAQAMLHQLYARRR